ncbi:hypothetical protein DSO57_1008697 [Entomophthora muscae]|uniref:Uncharacterized protein n=1 Tax=Entomophthora muscae TaxID=34485 RepID=A0ACC2U5K3_9FUNG|nr:hypothetical protein DSO57_1008697 [Entomophthora muscae]
MQMGNKRRPWRKGVDMHTTKESYEIRRYHNQETPTEKLERVLDTSLVDVPGLIKSFVPSVGWLPRYRRSWLMGDILSGFTVGVMLVPQSVAYARLAQLPVQYGLYSSFISNMVYAIFGGSREIAVGPNAVLSLMIADAVHSVSQTEVQYAPEQVAAALAMLLGVISIGLGSLRLGILLDLIPTPMIMGFTTGAACTIMTSQLRALLGIPNINTTEPTWIVLRDIFQNLPLLSAPDAYFGLATLLFLFAVPFVAGRLQHRAAAYVAIAVNAITVVLFTVISLIIHKAEPLFVIRIVGEVPSGFGYVGLPGLSGQLWRDMLPYAPGLFLVAILEHAAVCKNFSSKVGYTVSISQEFLAVGAVNLVGSFFSGFPVSGSLSRGAVLSKSGVRTPLAGMFIGLILLGALAFLTPAFYYIPGASLGAVIMRAGLSLLPGVAAMRELLRTNRVDFIVFSVAACVTYFFGVQYGISCAVGISFVHLVFRIARPKYYVLGEVVGRHGVFVDKRHPAYTSEDPEPGVVVFRVQESILFPNIGYLRQKLMDHVCEFTRSGAPPSQDRLWSSDINERAARLRHIRASRNGTSVPDPDSLPTLRAVILDLGAVNYIDASGIQGLKELRDQLYLYAGAHPSQLTFALDEEMSVNIAHFELHFVSIHAKVLRSLVLSGLPSSLHPAPINRPYAKQAPRVPANHPEAQPPKDAGPEPWEGTMNELATSILSQSEQLEPIVTNSSPFIHLTVHAAVESFRTKHTTSNQSLPTI